MQSKNHSFERVFGLSPSKFQSRTSVPFVSTDPLSKRWAVGQGEISRAKGERCHEGVTGKRKGRMARPKKSFVRDFEIVCLAGLMLLGVSEIGVRLWFLQIELADYYRGKARESSVVSVRLPSIRGEIRDRNGIPLVTNRPSYDVDFYLPDLVNGYRKEYGPPPMVEFCAKDASGMVHDSREPDIVQIVDKVIIPRLEEFNMAQPYSSEKLRTHYRTESLVPFRYRHDLDFATFARFAEKNLGLPGVRLNVTPVRKYVYGALAAHILGYVGVPEDLGKLPDIKDFDFYEPDVQGKTNIEYVMDDVLQGRPGKRILKKDGKNHIQTRTEIVQPTTGSNIYLTIDASMRWSQGQTANASIGQGYVLASPLQMAIAAATVANGGICYQPTLIYEIQQPDGTMVRRSSRIRRDLTRDDGLTKEQIELVRKGMWEVVNALDGTGKKGAVPGIEVAGKTGTAQFLRKSKKDDRCWFLAFAPYDHPKIAMAVMVEGGKSGGGVAAPIASEIMGKIFALDHGYDPGLKPLDAAVGNYSLVDSVSFKDSGAVVQLAPENRETRDSRRSEDRRSTSNRLTRAQQVEPDVYVGSHASAPPTLLVQEKKRGLFDFLSRKPEEPLSNRQPQQLAKQNKKHHFLFF
jgi:cell division protein FtsI/penicillin-binding protein 2